MIPLSGTFQYVAVVSDSLDSPSSGLRAAITPNWPSGTESLAGSHPSIRFTDAGFPTDSPPARIGDVVRPRVLRSKLTLTPTEGRGQTVSFHVDRGLLSVLRLGDMFNLARTGCGALD